MLNLSTMSHVSFRLFYYFSYFFLLNCLSLDIFVIVVVDLTSWQLPALSFSLELMNALFFQPNIFTCCYDMTSKFTLFFPLFHLPSNLQQPICPISDGYNICVTRSMRFSRFCIALLSLEAFPCCLYSPIKEPIMLPGWDTWMLMAYQIPLCQLRRAPQILMSTGLNEGR